MAWRASGCWTARRSASWVGCVIVRVLGVACPRTGRVPVMPARARAESEPLLLVVGAAGLVWRCRLELGMLALLLVGHWLLARVIGVIAGAVAITILAALVLALP